MSQCYACRSYLGCAVDCPNAPWNWGLPKTNAFGHLRRLAGWIRSSGGVSATIDRSSLHWLRQPTSERALSDNRPQTGGAQ